MENETKIETERRKLRDLEDKYDECDAFKSNILSEIEEQQKFISELEEKNLKETEFVYIVSFEERKDLINNGVSRIFRTREEAQKHIDKNTDNKTFYWLSVRCFGD